MEGWIPRGQTTGLYGVSGVLKTMFLLQLMLSASAGLSFCGLPIAEVPVLGLFCEDTKDEILRRLQRIAKLYRRDLDTFPNFHFVSLVGHLDTELLLFDRGTTELWSCPRKVYRAGQECPTWTRNSRHSARLFWRRRNQPSADQPIYPLSRWGRHDRQLCDVVRRPSFSTWTSFKTS